MLHVRLIYGDYFFLICQDCLKNGKLYLQMQTSITVTNVDLILIYKWLDFACKSAFCVNSCSSQSSGNFTLSKKRHIFFIYAIF